MRFPLLWCLGAAAHRAAAQVETCSLEEADFSQLQTTEAPLNDCTPLLQTDVLPSAAAKHRGSEPPGVLALLERSPRVMALLERSPRMMALLEKPPRVLALLEKPPQVLALLEKSPRLALLSTRLGLHNSKSTLIFLIVCAVSCACAIAVLLLLAYWTGRRGPEYSKLPAGNAGDVSGMPEQMCLPNSALTTTRRSDALPLEGEGRSRGASISTSISSAGSTTLCSDLVVQQSRGLTLLVNGRFAPCQQEEVVEVCNADASGEVILRIFVSESGRDSGVLLESGLRFPVAFLNTSAAAVPRGAPPLSPADRRQVLIYKAAAVSERGGMTQDQAFALAKLTDTGAVRVTRGADPGGMVLLTVNATAGGASVTVSSPLGSRMALLHPRLNAAAGRESLALHVERDVDLALALSAVIAAIKLGG